MSGITLQEIGGSLVINVPEEQTLIGRGQFLQVADKRVSRSHALLDVVEKKLYLTPTHTNPCFLKKHGSKEHTIMTKDVKTLLQHGDAFGLLPEQLYYLVNYPQLNGKKDAEKNEEKKEQESKDKDKIEKEQLSAPADKNISDNSKKDLEKAPVEEKVEEEEKEEDAKDDGIEDEAKDEKETDENQEVETPAGNMALPLEKKRPLPDWMLKASDASPAKAKPSPKKVTAAAVSKREPGEKLTKAEQNEEQEDEEEEDELEEPSHGKAKQDSDDEEEEFDDEVSDDDYVPEPETSSRRGKSKKRQMRSDSEDDFSNDDDDDDDYAPSKKKSRTPKKSPKGKGKKGARGRQIPSRSAKKTGSRGTRKRYSEDDDDDEDVVAPRGRRANNDDDDIASDRRPQRAARQKRGSYVDDPMVEEALEDFASEESEGSANDKGDSDFDVNDALDSGSDFDKKGKKLKGSRSAKVIKSPRAATKKGKKKAPRRQSKSKSYSDDDDEDDDMEDDEPYVPRPSKRRGGLASQESEESDDDKKKKRRREPCQYGRKCYRKNPVHFRTYCHPGDSSYDEEEKDPLGVKDSSKKPKEASKASPDKPSRPQRSTAGTRLVTSGSVDDDLPDTYDYNDSLINDETQATDDSGGDSDYNLEDDAEATASEANKYLKNKKMAKPLEAD